MATMNTGLGGPAGYGEGVFSSTSKVAGGSDDGSVSVDISSVFSESDLEFFGSSYSSLYINSNGLITFDGPDTSYSGSSLSDLSGPSIAPFWADHNLGDGGEIYWDLDPSAGTVTITWHDAAPYSGSGSNSYQVVLTDTGGGNFDIEIIYEDVQWADGGGSNAVTGITDGGSNHYPFEGSGNANDLSDYENNDFDGGEAAGVHKISIANGTPQSQDGTVDGGSGDDKFVLSVLDLAGDAVTTGADSILTGDGDDFVNAEDGDDTIHGGEGNDTILGGDGNDEIHGDGLAGAVTSTTTTIDASNFSDTSSGFTVSARNVEGGALGTASSGNVAVTMGGFGAGGTISDSDSGVQQQTGHDLASGLSEELIVEFDDPVEEASFSFKALFSSSYGEQAQWAIYDDGTLVAQSTFTEDGAGSGDGTIDLSGYGAFNKIVFTGLSQPDGSDGSDFLITEVTFTTATIGSEFDDSIAGGDGMDSIFGGFGQDTIFGNSGADTIFGEDGDDSILGGDDDDSISGGLGDDSMFGGTGADTISGGDGDDYIEGGLGGDFLTTGLGNDTLIGGEGDDTLHNSAGDDSLVGGDGNDSIKATEGDDTLEGGDGDDTLIGGADNDSLDGGAGNDTLTGDEGHDVLVGGSGADTLSGGDGDDTLSGGEGDDLLFGGDGNDVMTTGTGNDTLHGGAGDDTLSNSSGDDSLVGGSGNDSIKATEGDDTLEGGEGDDTLEGGADDDVLAGGTGDDSMSGGDDQDTFLIEDDFGDDTIKGGEGGNDFDVLDLSGVSGPANVTFTGDGESGTVTSGDDTIEFSEIEHVIGTSSDDTFDGSGASDGISVDAGGGADSVTGSEGDDKIKGGSGADTLSGGEGDDSLSGGDGDDTYVITSSGGADTILDFDLTDTDSDGFTNDQFDVSQLTGGTGPGGSVTWRDVTVTDDGSGNAVLTFPEGESVVLRGVAPGSMSTAQQMNASGIPCFAAGTMILTPRGYVPIETLRPSDLVTTRDNGSQPVLWVASRKLEAAELRAQANHRPVFIGAGAFGQDRPLIVSPQHGVMLTDTDGNERLVRAKHLAKLKGGNVRVMNGCRNVVYYHLLFEIHQLVWANGLASESFYPGPQALKACHPFRAEPFLRFTQGLL